MIKIGKNKEKTQNGFQVILCGQTLFSSFFNALGTNALASFAHKIRIIIPKLKLRVPYDINLAFYIIWRAVDY